MNQLVYGLRIALFADQGLKDVWAGQITYYKHIYHGWCTFVYYSESTKCIDDLCGEEMHEI